jgi:hypothetical protein
MPETYIPDPTRWTNNPNDLVALLSTFIVILLLYIVWKEIMTYRERKENTKTLQDVAESLNKLVGASNAKG